MALMESRNIISELLKQQRAHSEGTKEPEKRKAEKLTGSSLMPANVLLLHNEELFFFSFTELFQYFGIRRRQLRNAGDCAALFLSCFVFFKLLS